MAMSFGIPVGLAVIVLGAILLYASGFKTGAKIIIGIGTVITVFTFLLIFLAANSNM